ncbi:MAG: tyrosine-type recombinase/integrase [Pirellulaceae bacterium]|nr:tyrosine-type recombinase/integrase [Pirellulaceae bacterium]
MAMAGCAEQLLPIADRESLTAWFNLYMSLDGKAASDNTVQAKTKDLDRFLQYYLDVMGSDQIDGWTRVISEDFIKSLLSEPSARTGKPLATTSVNRILATVRTASKWIHHQRPFMVGWPMARIRDVEQDDPDWNGLRAIDVTRLKTASEQIIHVQRRKSQLPYRTRAIFMVLLHTAFRQSELRGLEFDQYDGKHFHRIRRKGKKFTTKIVLAKPAREALSDYFQHERGESAGPLFRTKSGKALSAKDLDTSLKRIAAQANSKLPDSDRIHLSAHMLRHTALKAAADKKGLRLALTMSGHTSQNYIWRYTQLSEEEKSNAIETLFD